MKVRWQLAALVAVLLQGSAVAFPVAGQAASDPVLTVPSDLALSSSQAAPASHFLYSPLGGLADARVTLFDSAVTGSLGDISARGYVITASVPHLLSGGLIAKDGQSYTIRDLEIVDRVSPDIALDFGLNPDLGRRFALADTGADSPFTGHFLASSANLPDTSSGDGAYLGTAITLGDDVSLHFGEAWLRPDAVDADLPLLSYLAQTPFAQVSFDQREAQTTLGGADWQFAPWGALDLTANHGTERMGMLTDMGAAPLSLSRSASSSNLGAAARIGFGGGWVTTFSYNEGFTQLDLKPTENAAANQTLRNRSYGISIAKHGLFGGDSLGLAVSRPINLAFGGVDLGATATADPFDSLLESASRPLLSGSAQQTDLELGYVTTFLDGALALQANAGYQMSGQPGLTNGVAVLSRAKINF
ncbi:MAG TPA: hypothetical protein VGF97_16410 [Rhizomicrobium sp.]